MYEEISNLADLQALAERGDIDAQYELGSRLLELRSPEAEKWLKAAAENGNVISQHNLGIYYYNGYGVPKDHKEAAKWYLRAAEAGFALSQQNLGEMFYSGDGVEQDTTQAIELLTDAAENGMNGAAYDLGIIYHSGKGVPQDLPMSLSWFKHAAERGHVKAEYNLGVMYEKGDGVPEDQVEAAKWFRMAANQGDPDSLFEMGMRAATANGVPGSFASAYMWLSLAIAKLEGVRREEPSKALATILGHIDTGDLERGKKLLRDWRPMTVTEQERHENAVIEEIKSRPPRHFRRRSLLDPIRERFWWRRKLLLMAVDDLANDLDRFGTDSQKLIEREVGLSNRGRWLHLVKLALASCVSISDVMVWPGRDRRFLHSAIRNRIGSIIGGLDFDSGLLNIFEFYHGNLNTTSGNFLGRENPSSSDFLLASVLAWALGRASVDEVPSGGSVTLPPSSIETTWALTELAQRFPNYLTRNKYFMLDGRPAKLRKYLLSGGVEYE